MLTMTVDGVILFKRVKRKTKQSIHSHLTAIGLVSVNIEDISVGIVPFYFMCSG
ncbi:MAG: hypothetical protein J5811_04540 [Lachnospiraceae bacterium]|nr:hypothetical protein [Lachnospiraceae bacterium]